MKRIAHLTSFIICAAMLAILTFFSSSLFFQRLEYIALDHFFTMRPILKTSDKIVIITIDESSLKQFGSWPWSREIIAYLISALNKYSPDQIMLDVFFSDEFPLIDHFLIKAMNISKRVSIPIVFNKPPYLALQNSDKSLSNYKADEILYYNEKIYNEAYATGHGHAIPDPDGIIRHIPLFIENDQVMIPQLALSTLAKHLELNMEKAVKMKNAIYIPHNSDYNKGIRLPVDKNGMLLINWAGPWQRSFNQLSFADFISSHESIKKGERPAIDLKSLLTEKICLVGLTAIGLIDIKPTPIDKNYPMLGVHANLLNSILLNNYISEPSSLIKKCCIILFPLILFMFISSERKLFLFYIFFFLNFVWLVFAYIVFIKFSFYLPTVTPIIGAAFCFTINLTIDYVHSVNEAKRLMQQAITDELTGLYTHRYFKFKLQHILAKNENKSCFSLILFDIDNFKHINDTYGHESGNIVLRELGLILSEHVKSNKIINCRYGGEEFCILLSNANKNEAMSYAAEMATKIRTHTMKLEQKNVSITVSMGVISSSETFFEKPEDFLKAADSAMYHAKNCGKNQVVYFSPEYFMYDKFSSPKTSFNQTINSETIKDPSSMEYVSLDLQKRNEELETIIQKMQNMQKTILAHEKETATRTLTSHISHELNKPIHNIKSSLKVIEKSIHSRKEKEFVGLIYEEIERINSLSRQMLDFYRPSEQKQKMHDINELLANVLKLSEAEIISKGIFLHSSYENNIPKTYCFGEELKQVFLNIIINSMDAVPIGGRIDVMTKREDDKISIIFKDNGKGIPKQVLARVFEPFFSTKTDSGGTGLGLSVSQSIIKKHNGTISAESEENRGTLFKIVLPIINLF